MPSAGRKNSCDYIHAAMLRTCKQLALEGAHFMYSNNVFAVDLSREAVMSVNSHPLRKRLTRHVSKNSQYDDTDQHNLPSHVNQLATFKFLTQIGMLNAAMIKHIEMFAQHTEEYKNAMPTITRIFKQSIPNLRTAKFYILAYGGDHRSHIRAEYEKAPEIRRVVPTGILWPFDPNSPSISVGSWPHIRDAIKAFIEEMKSLEVFEYGGCWNFTSSLPSPYMAPPANRVHFEGNNFDGYHWRLAMEEGNALEKEARKRCSENSMVVRDAKCPEVVNFRRVKRARHHVDEGVKGLAVKFFDGIFWMDN